MRAEMGTYLGKTFREGEPVKLSNERKRALRERARQTASQAQGEPNEVLRVLCADLHGKARKEARKGFWKEWK